MALIAAQKQQEAQTQYTKIAVEEAPPWYLMPPNDKGYVYGAGTATWRTCNSPPTRRP